MMSLEEQIKKILSEYGNTILHPDMMPDILRKYGFNAYEKAKERYLFLQEEHPVPELMKQQVEEYIEKMDGIATSSTPLAW